jgi:hypothetical protein
MANRKIRLCKFYQIRFFQKSKIIPDVAFFRWRVCRGKIKVVRIDSTYLIHFFGFGFGLWFLIIEIKIENVK